MSVLELATQERRELLELLRGLGDADWDAPTLCEGWAVRDVVAHIISFEGLGRGGLVRRLAAGRLWLDKINEVGVAARRDEPPSVLLDALERHLRPSGLMAGLGGRIALTDGMIHQQDIRRPLGAPRSIPAERLREALSFALVAPPIRGAWRVRGVRVTATDLGWSFGSGPEARGSGEAVLMTIAGRRGVARELTGPGAERLRTRLGG